MGLQASPCSAENVVMWQACSPDCEVWAAVASGRTTGLPLQPSFWSSHPVPDDPWGCVMRRCPQVASATLGLCLPSGKPKGGAGKPFANISRTQFMTDSGGNVYPTLGSHLSF